MAGHLNFTVCSQDHVCCIDAPEEAMIPVLPSTNILGCLSIDKLMHAEFTLRGGQAREAPRGKSS